ncbi:glycosyltransferase family 8 protein [Dickeya dadantii]|uniref:glycosyltransferase family 8 protein n=1 Tax=Dickeya dadantii TaxID=204038 RepID=UPI0021D7F51A|nr:glycosyltransferase family 8 protein [Dickeya dadantii]
MPKHVPNITAPTLTTPIAVHASPMAVTQHYTTSAPVFSPRTPPRAISDVHGELIKTLLNRQDAGKILDNLLAKIIGLGKIDAAESYLKLCVRYGADRGIARLLQNVRLPYSHHRYNLLLNAAHRLIDNRFTHDAETLVNYLREYTSTQPATRALHLKLLFRDIRLDELHEQFANIAEHEYKASEALLINRIRYDCITGHPERGLALLNEMGPLHTLSPQLIQWAVDCLLSLGRYEETVPLLEAWFGLTFVYEEGARRVLRIATHTGEMDRLKLAIERVHGWFTSADLVRLHAALHQLHLTRQAEPRASESEAALNVDYYRLSPPADTCLSLSKPLSSHAIFFCADAEYTTPTMVALTSLAMHNAHSENPPDIYLFVPPELYPLWETAVQRLAEAFHNLTLRIISTVQIPLDESRARYGFQTYGHMLSTTAYARIYASRYLYQLGVKRALYLDADIVVQRPLQALLYTDMEGLPLAACHDRPDPMVKFAIKLHGIPNGRYFNSGVLLFDMQHPATLSIIENAIANSEQNDSQLIFHDQCALNKAVRGMYHTLDESYNRHLPPSAAFTAIYEEASIVHFVSTPKPWHMAYSGDGSAIWSHYFHHAARIIGEECLPPRLTLNT